MNIQTNNHRLGVSMAERSRTSYFGSALELAQDQILYVIIALFISTIDLARNILLHIGNTPFTLSGLTSKQNARRIDFTDKQSWSSAYDGNGVSCSAPPRVFTSSGCPWGEGVKVTPLGQGRHRSNISQPHHPLII
ncbi:hypothetical protein J6590_102987 [Homalodisca vitripennis]|nr:hypothetical protein J6590_102987 [Homalodisca vitripennis]